MASPYKPIKFQTICLFHTCLDFLCSDFSSSYPHICDRAPRPSVGGHLIRHYRTGQRPVGRKPMAHQSRPPQSDCFCHNGKQTLWCVCRLFNDQTSNHNNYKYQELPFAVPMLLCTHSSIHSPQLLVHPPLAFAK